MKNTMKKTTLALAIALSLSACGGGGSSEPTTPPSQGGTNPAPVDPTPTTPEQNTTEGNITSSVPVVGISYSSALVHGTRVFNEYKGSGIVIGVMDTGFELSHNEFENIQVALKYNIIDPDNYDSNNPDAWEREDVSEKTSGVQVLGHGTQMLGIMASSDDGSKLTGLIPYASFALASKQDNAYDIDRGNAYYEFNKTGVSVSSNSFRYTPQINTAISDEPTMVMPYYVSEAIVDLATEGYDKKGIVFVFGAGNDNVNLGTIGYYGSFQNRSIDKEVLLVGALDQSGLRAGYSNYGSGVDVFVPAEVGTTITGNNYQIENGTSTATAIVSSIVAMARQARPDVNATVLMDLICKTADHIGSDAYNLPDENGNMRSATYGCGKVNADAFVTAVEEF